MNIPDNLKYTKNHEWIRIEGEDAVVGITDYAQSQLGDIVYIEVETIGEHLDAEEAFGTIEAVKTVSDLFMPVAGEVLEFNEELDANPELINKDAYNDGWIIRVKIDDPGVLEDLLDADAYKKLLEE